MNWVIVCFVWALWMSKHFWLHLWAHCFWLEFAGEVGVCEQLAEANWFVLDMLLKRLWVSLRAFCFDPGFQTLDFTNIYISAKGILPKPPDTHAQTQPLQLRLLKQASKLWAKAPWGAVRHGSQQNSWHSQHVQSMYSWLWEASISERMTVDKKLMCKSDKYHVGQKSVSAFVLSNNTIFINWYV